MSSRTLLPVALLPLCSLLALTLSSTAHAASQSGPIAKSEWTTSAVPDYIDMYLGLPDTLPEKPPIVVNIHSCMNNAGGQWGYDGFAPIRAAMDSVGFIMILPQQSRNCWNVGKPESLTHDGGGDTGAIVQMVKYALEKYNGDPTRVYVMGGSGGGMTTQALLAVYPEIFKAGSERAGVAAGCWAEGYADGDQWSGTCARGEVNKTAQEWGDFVRAINPEFTGPRPRIQMMHGNVDETINFNNLGESIEQWGNVLGLDEMPTSSDSGVQGTAKACTGCPNPVTYDRRFWQDECGFTVMEAWEALSQKHGMGYESEAILKWFGLDEKRDQDPWDAACGGMTGPGGDGAAGSAGAGPDEPAGTAGSGGTGPTEPMGGAGSGGMGTDVPPTTSGTAAPGTGTAVPTPVPTASQTAAPPVAAPGTSTSAPTAPITPPVAAPVAPVATPGATNTTTTATNTAAPAASSSNPTLADDAEDSGGGCSTTGRTTGTGASFAFIALGLLLGRRRRSAA